MGDQPLYTLVTALAAQGSLVNSTTSHFGVRTTSSALVGAGPLAPGGVRQYTIDGRPLVLRGGGFDPDLFLRYSAADTAQQIRLLRSAGLNTVRVEGHFMPQDFYDQMDAAGILVASGYSCCDAWELPTDTPTSSHDLGVLTASAYGVARNLRDHPSVFTFQWSDNNPTAPQEDVTLKAFRGGGLRRPRRSPRPSTSRRRSSGWPGRRRARTTGCRRPTGTTASTPPYADDTSLTNAGGAWALDSEESAGHTVPTRDSMDRFLSPRRPAQALAGPDGEPVPRQRRDRHDRLHLRHAVQLRHRAAPSATAPGRTWTATCGRRSWPTTRTSGPSSRRSSSTRPTPRTPSTGTIYWMANKGWPTLLWALYNADYDQAGSFFGAQEANRPLHALFDPSTKTVSVDNLTGQAASDLTVDAKVVSTDGTVLDARRSAALDLAGQQVRNGVLPLNVPATTTPPAKRVDLPGRARPAARVHGRRPEHLLVLDPGRRRRLGQDARQPAGDDDAVRRPHRAARAGRRPTSPSPPGPTRHGGTATTAVTLTNASPDATAFFLRADVRRGTANGHRRGGDDQVRTATWSANDLSLAPGESQTITATYARQRLHGDRPVVTVGGWNVPTATH